MGDLVLKGTELLSFLTGRAAERATLSDSPSLCLDFVYPFSPVSIPRVLTFILILFMFMFKTSTPSSAKTPSNRPCLSPTRPTPGSSDPLIKPSSPAVCPEPATSPKHVSSVTPRNGSPGTKQMKLKVRKPPLAKPRLLYHGVHLLSSAKLIGYMVEGTGRAWGTQSCASYLPLPWRQLSPR